MIQPIRLAISVEGKTEKEFFDTLIRSHLQEKCVEITPIIVTTKRVLDGPNHQGGNISLARVTKEIKQLLGTFDFVTTFYDLYGFKGLTKIHTAATLADEIAHAVGSQQNFIPYIQQYEFESLLFSDCARIGNYFDNVKIKNELQLALTAKGEAEKVNDSPQTCPSKRITNACKTHAKRNYDKPLHGPAIAQHIGLEKIRSACPLFSAWLNRLESLPTQK